jgi:hypothetical protein
LSLFPRGNNAKLLRDERELESSYTTRGINNKVTTFLQFQAAELKKKV